jgi:hypothetical protein
LMNQQLLQMRRKEIIDQNDDFVTDRSPVDNMAYMINQVGYHPMVTPEVCEEFLKQCVEAYEGLTHLIYIKPVQPNEVERNYSRVANKYYQKGVDAQFNLWLHEIRSRATEGPDVLVIDYWDLDDRKAAVTEFLGGEPRKTLSKKKK